MRVLVAGRNAQILAKAAGTFASDLTIQTAATKAASMALLERNRFDLIIACETLADGSGLEVLSHVAVNTPNTLRIFAARPSTLKLLKGELGLFGLFRTLPYPINFRKLWAALNLARSCQDDGETQAQGPAVRHVVLENEWRPAGGPVARGGTPATRASAPAARASVSAARTPTPATRLTAPSRPGAAPPTLIGTIAPSATRSGTAATRRPTATRPTRIPENDAFKRALAKRNASKLNANLNASTPVPSRVSQIARGNHGGRREPGVTNESLAQLAQLTVMRRSTYDLKSAVNGKNRAALFVGSGVFAAATAAVLTFLMLNANNSISRTSLPLATSINRPTPTNVLPWQQQSNPQQQQRRTTFIPNEVVAPAVSDQEVDAEAQSDASAIEPGHPGPPPPYTPPGPSEPPAVDYTGMVPAE